MAAQGNSRRIRSSLEKELVEPLFERIQGQHSFDRPLPDVVAANRLRRARERLTDALVSRGSANLPAEVRRNVETLVKDWAARSFEDGFSAVEEFEIRCAREHDLMVAEESGDEEQVLAVLERDYRRRVVEQFGTIELRGIQVSHRVTSDLDKVYVPLHVEKPLAEGEQVALFPPRIAATEILKDHGRILVVGAPGSGKSTLVSYLATKFAGEGPLPFVLVVRALREISLTPNGLARQLNFDKRLAARVLEDGRFVLLVDGVDEAPEDFRKEVIASLLCFGSEHPEARMMVTSRPAGAPGEIGKSLSGFQSFRLADLQPEEVDEFIDKWCLAAETSVRRDRSEAEKEARTAAEDLKSRIARSRSVQRIAVSPLLTTTLCMVHRLLGGLIPERRVTLYEKFTDALLYEWDRTKFPEGAAGGGLDARQKRTLLSGVARSLHEKHKVQMPEQEVVRHFAAALLDLGKPASDAQEIVREIRDRSGLLVERQPGYFAFSHLTFQEFLTALDYVESKSWKELIDRWEDSWWHEVIVLAAGAQGSDPARIARGLLAKKDNTATFLAAQCLETAVGMPLKVRQQIEKAIEKLLPPRSMEDVARVANIGTVAAPLLLRLLPQSPPQDRLWMLYALGEIDYDPAIPAIAQLVSDPADSSIRLEVGTSALHRLLIGEFATLVLLEKALHSDVAKRALGVALRKPQSPAFLELLQQWFQRMPVREDRAENLSQMIDDALKAARRDQPSSTRAKSTA